MRPKGVFLGELRSRPFLTEQNHGPAGKNLQAEHLFAGTLGGSTLRQAQGRPRKSLSAFACSPPIFSLQCGSGPSTSSGLIFGKAKNWLPRLD